MHINILKGLGVSYLFTFISFIIFSIILTFSNLSDTTIPSIILIISILGIIIGSATCTKNAASNGLLWGATTGIIYCLILYLLSSVLFVGFSFNLSTFYLILSSILFGGIGGIIGINLKKG